MLILESTSCRFVVDSIEKYLCTNPDSFSTSFSPKIRSLSLRNIVCILPQDVHVKDPVLNASLVAVKKALTRGSGLQSRIASTSALHQNPSYANELNPGDHRKAH
jgi:hypothetical protein